MRNSIVQKTLMAVAAVLALATAHADDAQLKIDGDLMMHPEQMANFFALGASKIKTSASWSWANMQFTQPYRTSWNDVTAVGPFDIQFDTSNLSAQDFGFSLTWANPRINVGSFDIHDTLTQIVGGVPLTFHLDGGCTGMALSIPGGEWKIKGHMHWDFANNRFVLTWQDFNLSVNSSAQAVIDIGQCQGPSDMFKTMSSALGTIAQDQSWLTNILRDGTLEWVQNTLSTLQTQLLQPRQIEVVNGLNLAWQPSTLSALDGGLIRVAGRFVISQPGASKGDAVLPRSYDPATLAQVKESGFVMPKDTLQSILGYVYGNGALTYRAKSSDISAFESLMGNRIFELFIWPDLMHFPFHSLFYFDLTTATVPSLTNGKRVIGGGARYDVSAPLLVHQWAPGPTSYLPYVDFTAPVQGQVYAILKNNNLSLITRLQSFRVSDVFRPEFRGVRRVSTYIATSMLGSQARSFIERTPLQMNVPDWDFGDGLSLGLKDVQAWPDSFRVPLDFKTQP